MQNSETPVPYPVIQRLSRYLLYVKDLESRQKQYTFSHEIADSLGLTSQTVRRDLSYLKFSGKPKKGYEISALINALLLMLGSEKEQYAVVVGAGNIGRGSE